jgi:anti-sigma regulatory factor (Ser/Thr protein kinase)
MTGDQARRAAGYESSESGGVPSAPAALEQDFDATSLYALRAAVAAHAAEAGLAPERVYDAVAAAHELAANAVRHGGGRGYLRLWIVGGILTCRVSDDGAAAPAGDGGPATGVPWPAEHGHGLWMVEQVADRFAIDRGPAGTTATFTFDR